MLNIFLIFCDVSDSYMLPHQLFTQNPQVWNMEYMRLLILHISDILVSYKFHTKLMVVTTQKACLIALLRQILIGINVAQDNLKPLSI